MKARSSHWRCSITKVFLKISQNSQGYICSRVYFLIKKLWHRCFHVNFAKYLRTRFLQNTSGGRFWKASEPFCKSDLQKALLMQKQCLKINAYVFKIPKWQWKNENVNINLSPWSYEKYAKKTRQNVLCIR